MTKLLNYARWIADYDTLPGNDHAVWQDKIAALSWRPKIAIVPISNRRNGKGPLKRFLKAIDKQIYDRDKVVVSEVATLATVAGVLSAAAEAADAVLPLPIDVILRPHCLLSLAFALDIRPGATLIYGDEDSLHHGRRRAPVFKPDWDPFSLLADPYCGVPTLFSSPWIRQFVNSEIQSRTIDNLLHLLTLLVSHTVGGNEVVHVPAILAHRQAHSDWEADEARALVQTHRIDLLSSTEIVAYESASRNRLAFSLPRPAPLVSVIILTRDKASFLSTCVKGILERTDYPNTEILIVDNGSVEAATEHLLSQLRTYPNVHVIRDDSAFNFSALNNKAAAFAKGEILVFLNNDVEIIDEDWLNELVSLASHPKVGAAGAKLLYPDHRIQHAGISIAADGTILHPMRFAGREDSGPSGELLRTRSTLAVTGACIAVRKELFLKIGGFNEALKVAFNDVDLCLRIAAEELSVVWSPWVELIHHESMTRGHCVTPETADVDASERLIFWSFNRESFGKTDPYHNPQLRFYFDRVDFASPPERHKLRISGSLADIRSFTY